MGACLSCMKAETAVEPLHRAGQSVLGKDTPDIHIVYEFGKTLGQGQFGTTRLVTNRATGEQLACKSIAKHRQLTEQELLREVQIMQHLAGHPHVVQLRGVHEDRHCLHLVMELCRGGELIERILQRKRFTERDAAAVMRTIVEVVSHCHAMSVVHRDIKPDNFLLSDGSEHARLQLMDFGLSAFFAEGQRFSDVVGTVYYMAPEVLARSYGKEADVWSCGVILYLLLSGKPPFHGFTQQEIVEAVREGEYDLEGDPWQHVSEQAKDCVRRMLLPDPAQRATPQEVLEHAWIRENGVARDRQIEPEVLRRIRSFAGMNRFKKEALKVIAANLPPDEIAGLQAMFRSLDKDGSGTITVAKMCDALRAMGSRIPEVELQGIMANADVKGDGVIHYQEFLAATMYLGKLEQEDNLYRAFQFFEDGNSGNITFRRLRSVLKQRGEGSIIAQHVWAAAAAGADTDRDGRINYDEFCAMMRQGNEETLRAASSLKQGILGLKLSASTQLPLALSMELPETHS